MPLKQKKKKKKKKASTWAVSRDKEEEERERDEDVVQRGSRDMHAIEHRLRSSDHGSTPYPYPISCLRARLSERLKLRASNKIRSKEHVLASSRKDASGGSCRCREW